MPEPLNYQSPLDQKKPKINWRLPRSIISILVTCLLFEVFVVRRIVGILKDFKAELNALTKIEMFYWYELIAVQFIAIVVTIVLQYTIVKTSTLRLINYILLTFAIVLAVIHIFAITQPLTALMENLVGGPTKK